MYNFSAGKNEKSFRYIKELESKMIKDLYLEVKDNILDLGCGDGVLTKNLSIKVPMGRVIAIDASERMIDTAKKMKGSNLQFRLMNINEMKFKERFDLIFSNEALHYVKDHKKLLENCNEILNYKGKIRFSFAGDGNCHNLYEVVKEIMSEKKYSTHFENFEWPWYMPSIKDYKDLIYKTKNFKDIEIYCENEEKYFENEDKLIEWIDEIAIVPFINVLPEKMKKMFRNKVVSKMMQKTNKGNGIYLENFTRINVLAQKI